jgi:triosephosphate isomerase
MRRLFIAGNWKMNTTREEAVNLVEGIKEKTAGKDEVDVGVCPPFVYLEAVAEAARGSRIVVAAQNVYFETKGAFTGEISPAMLKDIGCTRVVIGHSERRHVMHETDEMINKKVKASLAAGLPPILCVGELLEEREAGKTENVVKRHVQEGLKGVGEEDARQVVIAYEPVWAIGTGKTATPAQAQEVHEFIRSLLSDMYGTAISEDVVLQYGGSVKPENAKDLLAQKDIDGALVGGASLKVDSFSGIIDAACSAHAAKNE